MEVKDEYVADTSKYSGPLREAAQDADKFAEKNDKAALAVKRMGVAAKEGADKAARAQRDAATAAEKLKVAEEQAAAANSFAAEAAEKLEKGEIKAAEAKRASAEAAKAQERAERQATRAEDLKARSVTAAARAEIAEAAAANASAEAAEKQARAADKAADQMRQMARDAELGAAAENLAMLRASGSVKEHNNLLADLKKRFPELEKDGSKAFQAMTVSSGTFVSGLDSVGSSIEELSGMARLLPGAIIAGLELLPVAASVAASAITLGLGGAITGVGILFAAKNQEIREEFATLGKAVFSGLERDAQPFVGVLQHIGQYATTEFRSWDPLIRAAFAGMAPEVDKFAKLSITSLDKLKPAFNSIVAGFEAQLRALGPQMGPIMNNIATGVKAIGDAAQKNPQALASMAKDLSLIVRAGGDVIGFFTRFEGQITTAIEVVNAFAVGPLGALALGLFKIFKTAGGGGGGLFDQLTKGLQGSAGAAGDAASGMTTTGMATEKLMTAQQAAAMSSDQLKAALDRLTGANQTAFDAQTQYANALNAANEQAKKSNAGFDGMSKAVQANREALSSLAQAFKANLTGKTPQQIEQMRQAFINAAQGMGASKAEAKALADQLLGVAGNMNKIPDKKDTKLTANDNTTTGVASAKKSTSSFTDRVWRAQLTAQSKVSGAVHSAINAADGFAHKLYRANLTAMNRAGGVITSTMAAANRFASRTYRASLTAVNRAGAALASALAAGYNWAGRVFTATFNVVKHLFHEGGPVEGYADGGTVQGFPTGGPVFGPGTSMSDSIPAMLSNGEYVINARQANKWRGLLDSINYGVNGFAEGGFIEGYAAGGKAKKPTKAQLASAAATRARALSRPEELAALAAQQSLAAMRSSVLGGVFRGGRAGIGSYGNQVTQHVVNVTVNVQGSVSAERDLARTIQRQLITNRMPVSR